MKIIQNKKFIQKIFLLLLIVVSFNFICPKMVSAKTDESDSLGGVLINGVTDLFVALADGVVNVTHRFVVNQEESLIHIKESGWSIFGKVMLAIVIGVAVAAAIVLVTAGIGTIAAAVGIAVAGSGLTVATVAGASLAGGFVAYSVYNDMSNTLDLPVYIVSPQEIFYGQIPLLNVNFFEPEARESIFDDTFTTENDVTSRTLYDILVTDLNVINLDEYKEKDSLEGQSFKYSKKIDTKEYKLRPGSYDETTERYSWTDYRTKQKYELVYFSGGGSGQEYTVGYLFLRKIVSNENVEVIYNINGYSSGDWSNVKNIIETKLGSYGWYDAIIYEQYIANSQEYNKTVEVEFKKGDATYTLVIDNLGTVNEKKTLSKKDDYTNIASQFQPIVAKWFVTLRNVALVISMSILVYIGIRMMLTSVAAEKAKYKTMLVDWFIGVGLIFVMQYIMIFGTTLNDMFIDLINNSSNVANIEIFERKNSWKLNEKLTANGINLVYADKLPSDADNLPKNTIVIFKNAEGKEYLAYPTNLMGKVRIALQNNRNGSLTYVGYAISFMVLSFYTIFFIITYIKRVIYMAFLTIIAPFVAMTYSLDKLTDGKAQAFNMWLKEYIFNLLIQPMHLLLYYILIISAYDLAGENILYTLVALGFMIPAEKLIRKFFGFDKAQTPGFLGGAAGAAIVMSTVGSLRKFASPGKGGASKEKDNKNADGKIRTKSQKLIEAEQVFNDSDSSAASNIRTTEGGGADVGSGSSSVGGDSVSSTAATDTVARASSSTSSGLSSSSTSGDDKTPKFSIRGAAGGLARHAGRGLMRLTGKVPGLAARGFGAATLGAVGLAAGIASGDPNNALQYALTGGAAGSALGAGLSNRASGTAERVADDVLRGGFGEDYDEYMNRKADKMFLNNKDNRDFYRSMFGDNYENAMKDAIEYRKLGITDNKIIAKAMKLKGYDPQMQLYLAQLASGISNRSDWARARETFKGKGLSDAQIGVIERGISSIKNWK